MAELAAGEMIATDEELTHFDRTVMWVLTSHLGLGNVIKISQAEVGRRLKSDPAQISRSISRLVKRGYLEKRGKRGYKLSTHVGTMGSRKKLSPNGLRVVQGDKE